PFSLLLVLSSQFLEERRLGLDQDPPFWVWQGQGERVVQVNDIPSAILLFDHNPIRRVCAEQLNDHLDGHHLTIRPRHRQPPSDDHDAIATTEPVRTLSLVQEQRTRSPVWHSHSISGLTAAAHPRPYNV